MDRALIGRNYGRIDIERVGNVCFIKLPQAWLTVNRRAFRRKTSFVFFYLGFFTDPSPSPFDVYQDPDFKFRENVAKGRRQILAGPPSELFVKKHERIFEGEALTEPWREEAKKRVSVFALYNNYPTSGK